MKLSREQIRKLVELVVQTRTEELDCDEMVRMLAAYAEKLASGQPLEQSDDEAVQHHLSICPECCEEFEMLRSIAEEGNLEA